ncbi:transcription termination factor Rho [Leucobacter sp. OLJS4]|uniref:transcription termination factor Rho n=1 Tax=unclassified Leucobacter TaxID=2621730 RepID=UPI000C476CE1|nr:MULTISPECIES: transcription termination factor Rho [unclassified Leucobacter]PII82876.1 transcription termination factor Rho [Leucobacter sp. OLCALW19]PII88016.1 transcription termination factor Rho [Leucobacter sp. OLTLW20]PII91874.1 transcription termination factor Rho [Leucobacter sp. OLAS13]PIJ00196.1 transcription termination factor Rho [Leucobacter sp. OLDS2]PIJ04406.1 transcription termination factor Rho [Leucobacter sp. OLIS6]
MEQNSEETTAATAADAAPAEATAPARRRTSRRVSAAAGAPVEAPVEAAPAAEAAPAEEAPKKRATRSRKKVADTEAPAEAPAAETAAAEAPAAEAAPAKTRRTRTTKAAAAAEAPAAEAPAAEAAPAEEAPKKRATRSRKKVADTEAPAEAPAAEAPAAEAKPAEVAEPVQAEAPKNDQADAGEAKTGEGEGGSTRSRNRRNRNKQNADAAKNDAQSADAETESSDDAEKSNGRGNGRGGNRNGNDGAGTDNNARSSRTRQRERKRRGQGDDLEPELTEDDVLLPIAGVLDVLDNYAFVRTTGYLPGTGDVYVSLGQVKKYHLRKGDAIVGAIRQPRDGEGGGRQKYNAIVKIDSVNGRTLEENENRVEFADLTPLPPQERLRLETGAEQLTQRVIDLVAPIGKGQRGLIVAPPKSGKTVVLQQIADAISKNAPEAHLMVVLVDERPEEVTELQRSVNGEVIASTFDRPAEDHTTVAELAIERAKRLVELGHDVVVLLDSLTRLGRAYGAASPASGRSFGGVLDAAALAPAKKFFGAARNIENGGSLTIIATALVETGAKADEVVLEEFAGAANMELRLVRELADKRIFPAVDLNASSTHREEVLLGVDELQATWKLRRALGDTGREQALESVLRKLGETSSNAEFLLLMQKSQGLS